MISSTFPLPSAAVDANQVPTLHNKSLQHLPRHDLAAVVLHNLRFQHDWRSLTVHTNDLKQTSQESGVRLQSHTRVTSPRPIISGVPPRQLYVHPDDQLSLIKAGINDDDIRPQREWILPVHLQESWTLRDFGELFDSITSLPPDVAVGEVDVEALLGETAPTHDVPRRSKRVLLGAVDQDSTVVYYIVHEGIVKPNQN